MVERVGRAADEVVSRMDDGSRELELERHGYKVYPQHGYFVPYRDGGALQLPDDDPARRGRDEASRATRTSRAAGHVFGRSAGHSSRRVPTTFVTSTRPFARATSASEIG